MALERRTVEVWADWRGLPSATRIGTLHATPSRGKEIFSFEYDRGWLDAGHARSLDPSLQLVRGPQYVATGHENFGVFLDSSPDRWGRVLMQRREAQLARETKRSERKLFELDYLLGVYDGHRMGALRYRVGDGPFLDDNTELASPPWTSLRELEQASLALERPAPNAISRSHATWPSCFDSRRSARTRSSPTSSPRSAGGASRPRSSVYLAATRTGWPQHFSWQKIPDASTRQEPARPRTAATA
jgi:hypothetical protein